MNSETGRISDMATIEALPKSERAKHFLVDRRDMTDKQKLNGQVSLHDSRSTLGKLRIERRNSFRNKPCPCGSGVKFKKCCWNKTF